MPVAEKSKRTSIFTTLEKNCKIISDICHYRGVFMPDKKQVVINSYYFIVY